LPLEEKYCSLAAKPAFYKRASLMSGVINWRGDRFRQAGAMVQKPSSLLKKALEKGPGGW
jgi:hypothetical protein